MPISKKTADTRRDNPTRPHTRAERIDHLERMRDILNIIPRGGHSAAWEAIGGIRCHITEALEPGHYVRGI
jgi:hypothetical protein